MFTWAIPPAALRTFQAHFAELSRKGSGTEFATALKEAQREGAEPGYILRRWCLVDSDEGGGGGDARKRKVHRRTL